MSEVAIEIDHPRNCSEQFFPCETGRRIRSRWIPFRFGAGIPPHKMMLPELPGQTIHLDLKTRKGIIKEPAALEENRALVDKWKAAYRQGPNPQELELKDEDGKPFEAEKSYNLSELESLQWQYWMRRFVDNGTAKVVKGTLPEIAECRAMLGGEVPGPNLSNYPNDIWRTPEELYQKKKAEQAARTTVT